ncbi:hypothetical protein BC831DRAFT_489149 [Entophlyctis helioformis]|nr:hypothetical protein BC831DRAFT_489149 [Entophlyctis helioformis]
MAGGILSFSEPLVWAILLCTDFSLIAFVRSSLTGNCSFVDRFWSITPILYAWTFAIFARVNSGSFDFRCHRRRCAGDGLGCPPHMELCPQGRIQTRRGRLPLAVPARAHHHQQGAVRSLQLRLHLVLPKLSAACHCDAAVGRIPQRRVCHTQHGHHGHRRGRRVPVCAAACRRDDRRQPAVQLPDGQVRDAGETDPQRAQAQLADLPAPFKYGFSNEGLFSISRHPNFFCEFMQWWALYLLSVAAAPGTPAAITAGSVSWINWTVPGTVLLTLLFLGSTAFTEYISAQKYPLYAVYKTTTSMLVPWIPGPRDLEAVAAAAQA